MSRLCSLCHFFSVCFCLSFSLCLFFSVSFSLSFSQSFSLSLFLSHSVSLFPFLCLSFLLGVVFPLTLNFLCHTALCRNLATRTRCRPGIIWAGWQELFLSNAFSAPSCLIQNDLHESVQNYCLQWGSALENDLSKGSIVFIIFKCGKEPTGRHIYR